MLFSQKSQNFFDVPSHPPTSTATGLAILPSIIEQNKKKSTFQKLQTQSFKTPSLPSLPYTTTISPPLPISNFINKLTKISHAKNKKRKNRWGAGGRPLEKLIVCKLHLESGCETRGVRKIVVRTLKTVDCQRPNGVVDGDLGLVQQLSGIAITAASFASFAAGVLHFSSSVYDD